MGVTKDEAGRIWSDRAQDMTDKFLDELDEYYQEKFGRPITQEEIDDLIKMGNNFYPEAPSDIEE